MAHCAGQPGLTRKERDSPPACSETAAEQGQICKLHLHAAVVHVGRHLGRWRSAVLHICMGAAATLVPATLSEFGTTPEAGVPLHHRVMANMCNTLIDHF
jgi:hypothetical protein